MFLITPTNLMAQEEQVFWDEKETVLEIGQKEAQKAGLFQEYPNLISASLFRFNEDEYIIEIVYEQEKRRLRERLSRNAQEVAAIRKTLSPYISKGVAKNTKKEKSFSTSGKIHYLINTSYAAFGIYGPAAPVVVSSDNWQVSTGLYLLTAGAGFIAPLITSQNKTITPGMARLHGYGTSRGFMHGIALANLMSPNPDIRLAYGMGALTTFGESLAGYYIAKDRDFSRHQSATIGLGGDLGSITGLGLYGIMDAENFDNPRALSLLGLAGTAGGLVLGNSFAKRNAYSVGDTRVMRVGGMVGASFGLYMIGMIRPENPSLRGLFATELLTGVAGLVGTHYLIRDVHFTGGEGILVGVGAAAGGALGLGIGLLSGGLGVNDDFGISRFTLTSSMLGIAGGFLLTTWAFRKNSEKTDDFAWNVGLAPEGMMGLMPGMKGRIDPLGGKGNAIIQAGIRF